ncbi:hypothetical protein [Salinibacterium sp. ZJ454]|uniref:5-methylcytosine restriction system specificity protein McrC n=1 Tax=Salinibacterium sp. ZJ454 TaxID=2708339 RepID=UPI001423FE5A|nr:hypothetical protein [Salinibacterium sp. ZJ454]
MTLHEAHWTPGVVQSAVNTIGAPESEIREWLAEGADRLRRNLGLDTNPVELRQDGSVRVDRIAGILKFGDRLELEVAPKHVDPADVHWRNDFFVLALFTQTGQILPLETIESEASARGDLATLVGRTFARLYWDNHRRPMRTYRSRRVQRFSHDGDVDSVTLVLPEEGGFAQQVLELDRDNELNAVIASAAQILMMEVGDSETRRQLMRVVHSISPQAHVATANRRALPARNRQWQILYDLSVQVLEGLGLSYNAGIYSSPGYVLQTWPAWQQLCEAALRAAGLEDLVVDGSPRLMLGTRASGKLMVTPDVLLRVSGLPRVVVDAKYRTRDSRSAAMSNSDIYEVLAFMRASETREAVLLYPRPASAGPAELVGTVHEFERVTVDDMSIAGLTVEARGISGSNGFRRFAANLGTGVKAALR